MGGWGMEGEEKGMSYGCEGMGTEGRREGAIHKRYAQLRRFMRRIYGSVRSCGTSRAASEGTVAGKIAATAKRDAPTL